MSKKLSNKLREPKSIALVVLGVLVLVVGILWIVGVFSSSEDAIKEGQIQMQKGNRVVTVNENGLVEYRSDDGVFYETWDSSRTNAFFATMEATARNYLATPPDTISENAYKITLWIDGEIVVIYIDEDDEVLGDVLEEIFDYFDGGDGDGDGDLSDYFDGGDGDGDGDGGDGNYPSSTPTLPPGIIATPTPVGSSNGGGGGQTPPDCDLYGSLVTGRTVISNTICQIEEN